MGAEIPVVFVIVLLCAVTHAAAIDLCEDESSAVCAECKNNATSSVAVQSGQVTETKQDCGRLAIIYDVGCSCAPLTPTTYIQCQCFGRQLSTVGVVLTIMLPILVAIGCTAWCCFSCKSCPWYQYRMRNLHPQMYSPTNPVPMVSYPPTQFPQPQYPQQYLLQQPQYPQQYPQQAQPFPPQYRPAHPPSQYPP